MPLYHFSNSFQLVLQLFYTPLYISLFHSHAAHLSLLHNTLHCSNSTNFPLSTFTKFPKPHNCSAHTVVHPQIRPFCAISSRMSSENSSILPVTPLSGAAIYQFRTFIPSRSFRDYTIPGFHIYSTPCGPVPRLASRFRAVLIYISRRNRHERTYGHNAGRFIATGETN